MTNRKHLSDHKRQWEKATIEECFDILKGKGLSKAQLAPDGIYSCILYGELFTTYSEVIDVVYSSTNSNGGEDSKAGDILLPASTTTKGVDLARASALLQDNVRLGGDINILRPKRDLDSAFMAMYLNVVKRDSIAKKTKGTTIHHLHGSDIKDIIIELPEMSAQTTISNLIRTIDQAAKSIKKLIEKKKLIKLGVMQELLTGKRRLPGFTGEWEKKRYGDIFQFLGTANYTRDDLIESGGIKYVHYGDVHTKLENYVDIADASIPTIQDIRLKQYPLLESGDLIMVDTSEDYSGVGKSVEVINASGIRAISGLHTFLLRDTKKVFADGYRAFIHLIPSVKTQLDYYATGMKVYSISKKDLAKIEIPIPPKDEQEAITNTIICFLDDIKTLETRLSKYVKLKQAMMQELLTGRIRLL